MRYQNFLAAKSRRFIGKPVPYKSVNKELFSFQSALVQRALDQGRYAIFADCGLGKTLMELEWAANIPGPVLIVAPLAVAEQIQCESIRFGYTSRVCQSQEDAVGTQIAITNYEKLHHFDASHFAGVVLDESSILKSYTGKIRTRIIEMFGRHRHRLAATATPAPNDFQEIGNHAEFLGVMTRAEMLSMFFVHDGGSTQDWRLKGHAKGDYWKWMASWCSMIRRPSDLGFDDNGFILPPMHVHHHMVESDFRDGALIRGTVALDLNKRRAARRESIKERVECAARLDDLENPYLLWCDLNAESDAIARRLDCAEVKGSDSDDHKSRTLTEFAEGKERVLVTKPKIGGWGMNWQHCSRMAFVGVSDSYEAFYQSTRRCWRFGQKRPVDVHLIYSESETAVIENMLSKERMHREMQDALVKEIDS